MENRILDLNEDKRKSFCTDLNVYLALHLVIVSLDTIGFHVYLSTHLLCSWLELLVTHTNRVNHALS